MRYLIVFAFLLGGCATTKDYVDLAYVHNVRLDDTIDTSIAKQEASDIVPTKYRFSPYYYPGTSVRVFKQ